MEPAGVENRVEGECQECGLPYDKWGVEVVLTNVGRRGWVPALAEAKCGNCLAEVPPEFWPRAAD